MKGGFVGCPALSLAFLMKCLTPGFDRCHPWTGPWMTSLPSCGPTGDSAAWTPVSSPSTADSLDREPHSSPRMAHSSPRMAHSSPRMAHSSPRMAHSSPRMAHSSPRMAHSSPRMAHSFPQMAHASPRMAHSSPRMARSSPRVGCSSPRMGCSFERIGQLLRFRGRLLRLRHSLLRSVSPLLRRQGDPHFPRGPPRSRTSPNSAAQGGTFIGQSTSIGRFKPPSPFFFNSLCQLHPPGILPEQNLTPVSSGIQPLIQIFNQTKR